MKEQLEDNRILFVGLNTVDLQFLVNHYPKANTKTKAHHNEIFVGGPATNAAIACAHLGSGVDLYTPIGKHLLSDFILEDLAKYNIGLIDPIAEFESKPVFASIITSQQNGDRTIFSYHPENKTDISSNLNFKFSNYSLVLFDGFHPELAVGLAKEARNNSIPTVLDGGSWKPGLDELLQYIDVAICSKDFMVPDGSDPASVINRLHQKGVKQVAITQGDKNILYSEDAKLEELKVKQVEVIDTLGAGDIFHGAFCHYYNLNNNFSRSLQKAGLVASESCRSFGTREWMRTS